MALVAHRIWACDSGTASQYSVIGGPNNSTTPYCSPAGTGQWITVWDHPTNENEFTALDVPSLANAFGAGFLVVGVPLVIVMVGKVVLRAYR